MEKCALAAPRTTDRSTELKALLMDGSCKGFPFATRKTRPHSTSLGSRSRKRAISSSRSGAEEAQGGHFLICRRNRLFLLECGAARRRGNFLNQSTHPRDHRVAWSAAFGIRGCRLLGATWCALRRTPELSTGTCDPGETIPPDDGPTRRHPTLEQRATHH